MIVVALTFSNNSLSELHVKYFSRISFRLQHASRICLTVREHLHSSQSSQLNLQQQAIQISSVLKPSSDMTLSQTDINERTAHSPKPACCWVPSPAPCPGLVLPARTASNPCWQQLVSSLLQNNPQQVTSPTGTYSILWSRTHVH